MAEFQGYCCEACFNDEYISAFIQKNGEPGDCPYCKSKNVFVCDTESVGDFIKDGLRRAYEEADYTLVKEGCAVHFLYTTFWWRNNVFFPNSSLTRTRHSSHFWRT